MQVWRQVILIYIKSTYIYEILNRVFAVGASDDVDDLDQTKEEEGDPSEFEKKKDHYNIYENELHPKNIEEDTGIKDYTQFDGINDDWEEFNERDFSTKKGSQ